jgi:two-component system chemotaxis response regulator CheB
MPVMNGIMATKHIMIECPTPIVVLSSLTNDGRVTFEALRLGVVDFVPKPSGAVSVDIDSSRQALIDRIRVARTVNLENVRRVWLKKTWNKEKRLNTLYGFIPLEYLVAVGTSLSGPNTVIRLMSQLPPTVPACALVVQEISPRILGSFVREFNEHVPWKVEVAEDGTVLEQGVCYIGSNENCVGVDKNSKGKPVIRLSEKTSSPLDHLFTSAANVFGNSTIGVLLTGLGMDGTAGFSEIRKVRGVTLAQDANCCVYPNLTAHAIESGVVDKVVDEVLLGGIIEKIMG